MCCMEEGGAGIFSDVLNVPFGYAILVVRTDATEGNCLVHCPIIVHKGFVGDIITSVMEDSYPVLLGKALKRVFRVNCFVSCEVLVHVDVCEVTCVVHEHRRTPILADRRLSFYNGYEAWDSSWSTLTTVPGTVVGLIFGSILCVRHGFW